MYSRIRTAAAIMLAVASALASVPVQADFYTEQSTIDVKSLLPPAGAPITQAILIDTGAGRTFTNTYGVDASGDALVRSVGVIIINNVKTAANAVDSGITGPGSNSSQQLVVAFALDGHTLGATNTVQFTSGGAGIWQAPTNVSTDDATKWFLNFNNPIWGTALAPQTNVFVGNGDTLGGHNPGTLVDPASITNLSSINAANPNLIQSTLLFNENFDPNHFLDTTTNFSGVPGGTDSVLAIANLTIGNQQAASDLLNADTAGGGTAAQKQAVVNNLAAFFGLPNLGGANTAFATFGTGTATDYRPGGGGLNNNDFSTTATVQVYSGLNVPIPEPSTMGLMTIGSVAIGLFARFRSNRKT